MGNYGHLCQSGGVTTAATPDYRALLAFRTALRRFERWSERQAEEAGLTPAQHQLLLAVKGHDDDRGPTMSEVADYLLLRHHSAVELVNRAQAAGLVERVKDDIDGRVVRLHITRTGEQRLRTLAQLHRDELEQLEPLLRDVVTAAGGELPLSADQD
jgi:DNA-binding MarR family transcriptional regulator